MLHVCVGNICRSPMAERLLALALRQRVGGAVDELYRSHGAGTGTWHLGEAMNPPAARQVVARGGDASGFRARQINGDLVDMSDLLLCATATQVKAVVALRPEAVARTFVLGEFGRLLPTLDLDALPPVDGSAQSARERGIALVAAVDAARRVGGTRRASRPEDDLDDPWGEAEHEFVRVADEIEQTVVPLAAALTV